MLNRFNTSFPFPFQRGEQERSVPDERWTLVEPRFESARIVFPWHFQVSSSPSLESGPRAGSWTWTGDRGGEAAIKLAEFHVDRDKGSRRLCRSRLKKKKKGKKTHAGTKLQSTICALRLIRKIAAIWMVIADSGCSRATRLRTRLVFLSCVLQTIETIPELTVNTWKW